MCLFQTEVQYTVCLIETVIMISTFIIAGRFPLVYDSGGSNSLKELHFFHLLLHFDKPHLVLVCILWNVAS